MTPWEWLLDVLSNLENLLKNLQDDQGNTVFKEVVVGWKKEAKNWPAAYILPTEDLLEVPSVSADYFRQRWVILVVDRKVTVKGSLQAAITLAGRVHEALAKNRTLNNTCDNLEIRRYDYMWNRVREYRREYIALVVEFQKYLVIQ